MLSLFFITPLEIVGAFCGGVLSLLGIGKKVNSRNSPKNKKRKK